MRTFFCGLLAAICTACAAPIPPLSPGEELAIVSEKRVDATVVNTDIGKGAAAGVAGGAVAGVGYAVLAAGVCGPFYAFCLANTLVVCGATGAVAGGIAGGAVGVMIGISPEKRDKLIANLASVDA